MPNSADAQAPSSAVLPHVATGRYHDPDPASTGRIVAVRRAQGHLLLGADELRLAPGRMEWPPAAAALDPRYARG
ncbi:hypothetical protein [Saccharopolyspora pogona]|uniref:hypothetical protein n=1 Tax=Saccharopolyspora pogona TaxID=333966 RepID=UPI001687EFB0|nr:hypothetical protein [Saccharopolyspora pogona]